MSKKYKYKFSIVTAVYNTQEYVADAIESVINQSIGFKENVQLILVNDGSKDNSPKICKEYRDRYPDNIVYIEKENGGVSSARNRGLEEVEGKYVNFLDSDDKLSKNTLSEVWKFFEKHYDEIDFVSLPMYFFGASKNQHMMNWRFDGIDKEIIDIKKKPQYIQLSSCSSILKTTTLKKYKFDTKLKYAEDVKIINQILLEKEKYGILNTTKYLYRKRDSADSAMNQTTSSKNWYFNALEDAFFYLLKTSKKKFGRAPKYYQYLAMYDLQFRLKQKNMALLDSTEKKKYISIIKQMLQYIDDDVIFDQRFYFQEHKIFALSLKYDESVEQIINELKTKDDEIYFRKTLFQSLDKLRLDIRNFKIEDDKLFLEGIVKTILPVNKLKMFTNSSKGNTDIEPIPYRHAGIYSLEQEILKGYRFRIEIPTLESDKISFAAKLDKKSLDIKYYFAKGLESRYVVNKKERKILRFIENKIIIDKYSIFKHLYYELKYFFKLLKKKEIKVIGVRVLYWIFKMFKFRELWLIIERPTAGGDNAQAFFEYAVKQKDSIKKVFVISKKSKDFQKIRNIGKVVDWKSLRHLVYTLTCDKLISSHADNFILNPYGRWGKYLRDLYTYDYIFLQHGIIKDDLSNWLNKLDKNAKLFITSAKPEYDSMFDYDYLYSKNEILLSGLPRFDKLKNNPQKRILIMPTWREFLTSKTNSLGVRGKVNDFKDSDFYKFYNGLITNKELLDKANKLGYQIKLCLHPAIISEADTFEENKYIEISKDICNYSKEFSEGSLLVTDYSSVAFDFAYLRKPVIYSQFDYKEAFSNHIYEEGYFKYKRDGFGPVCEDLDSTVNNIIKVLENGCKLEKKYRDRIDGFFKYNDKKNCERVYNAILDLDKSYPKIPELNSEKLFRPVSAQNDNWKSISNILLSNRTYLYKDFVNYEYEQKLWGTLSPTYNLYLNCLNDVGYLTSLYLSTKEGLYLEQAENIIKQWFQYKNSIGAKDDKYLWSDHAISHRTLILIDFLIQRNQKIFKNTKLIKNIKKLLNKQGIWLYDNRNYSNGNHGLMMDQALLEIGLFQNNVDYVKKAIVRINNRIMKDFTSQGIHLENSPGYQIFVMNIYKEIEDFLNYYKLRNLLTDETQNMLNKMPEYLAYIVMPNKKLPPIGDSPKTFLTRNYGNKMVKYVLNNGSSGEAPPKNFNFFKEAGIATYRNHYDSKDSIWWTIKSGSNNKIHKHDDDLSFMLYGFGKEIFTDAGKYNYDNENLFRKYVLSPSGHNSISIKDKPYFAVNNLNKIGNLEFKQETDEFIWLSAINRAYSATTIIRDFIFYKPNILIIIDRASSSIQNTFLQSFLLSPEMHLNNYSEKFLHAESKDRNTAVYLRQYIKPDNIRTYTADKETGKGYISENFETKTPIDYIEFEITAEVASFITTIELNPEDYKNRINKINLEKNFLKVNLNKNSKTFNLGKLAAQ
jgi:CDP-glycerol glycerophosphotransferase (TagB/SpsB family)/glycosyltransferase involved in cell wall biosynthesis